MAVQEDLNAIFSAENNVSPKLTDIATDALEAASGLETLETAADTAEGALDALERTAVSTGVPLEAVESQIEAVGDEALRQAAKVEALDASLSDLDAGVLADVTGVRETDIRANVNEASTLAASARLDTLTRDRTVGIDTDAEGFAGLGPLGDRSIPIRATVNNASFAAARAAIAGLPGSHTVDVLADVDRDSFSIPQLAGGTVPFAAGGLSTPDVSPDARTVPFQSGDLSLPDIAPDARTIPFETGEIPTPDVGALPDMPSLSPDIQSLDFEAALPDGGIADALPSLSDQSVAVDVEGVDQLAALQATSHLAAEGLDEASRAALESSTANALAASAADEAGDGFLSMVPGGTAAASALDSVRSSAFGAVPGLTAAGSAADEYGDEASEAAAETAALQASMAGLGGSGVGTELLGFHGSLSSIATILPGIIALLGGLVAPLGAITVAAGGAGSALAAMAGAGLLAQGEQLVGTYQEVDGELKRITSTAEGAEVVLGNLKDRAADIFSALQTGQTSQFFTGLTEGGFTVLEDFVGLTNQLMGPLLAMSDRLGAVFAATEPETFAELEATTRALLPTIERLAGGAMRALPDFLAWVRTEGIDTADALFALAGSALDLGVELAEVGGVVWQTIGPALSWLFGVVAFGADIFTRLPGPIQQAAVAAAIAAPVLSALAGSAFLATAASSGLAAALGTLTLPISGTVAALAALIGVGVAVANHFGLIDDIVGGLAGTFNGILDVIEWTANSFLNLYDMAKPILMLIPGIGSLVWLFDNWRAVVDVLGDALAFVIGKAQDLVKWLDELSGFDEFIGRFIGQADDRRKGQAQVDLSGFKVGEGGAAAQGGRGGGGPGGPQGPQQPPGPGGPGAGAYGGSAYGGASGYGGGQAGGAATAAGGGGTTVQNTVNYYEQNGDAKSGPSRERRVRSIVRQMNDETRRAGTGMN